MAYVLELIASGKKVYKWQSNIKLKQQWNWFQKKLQRYRAAEYSGFKFYKIKYNKQILMYFKSSKYMLSSTTTTEDLIFKHLSTIHTMYTDFKAMLLRESISLLKFTYKTHSYFRRWKLDVIMEMNLYLNVSSTIFRFTPFNKQWFILQCILLKLKVTLVRNFMSPFPVFPENLRCWIPGTWEQLASLPNLPKCTQRH